MGVDEMKVKTDTWFLQWRCGHPAVRSFLPLDPELTLKVDRERKRRRRKR
jgi:hypothetical protein